MSNFRVFAVRLAVCFFSPELRHLVMFQNVLTVRCDCCSVALSPIKDGLPQQGDGILAQAPADGANMFAWSFAFASHFVLNSESVPP